jgi:hypothetical protein
MREGRASEREGMMGMGRIGVGESDAYECVRMESGLEGGFGEDVSGGKGEEELKMRGACG